MLREDRDFVGELLENVSKRIGKPFKYLAPFQEELRKNWYDTPQALMKATDAEFQKMNIPLRVAIAIREELGVVQQPSIKQPSQQNINKNAKQASLGEGRKVTEATMLQSIVALEEGVMKKYPWVGEELPKIFETLLKIIKNILSDPYQLKFRVLKKSNAKIKQIILDNPPVVKFLKEIGFEENQQTLALHKFEIHELYFIEEGIQAVVNNHTSQNKPTQPKKVVEERSPFLPSNIKFPQNKQSATLENAFSKGELQEANYAQILDKLMEYRAQLMAKPPQQRQIRIYHKKYEVRETNFQECNLQNQMERSDDMVLAKYWKNILKMNRTNSNFQSRRKNEFQFLVKQKIYRQTIIKVRLPNELIIQARFSPLQTLQDVLSLAAGIVIGDIYLYQSPPVKRLDKLLYQTLENMDSVPTGNYYLGINNEWYIKNQYVSLIRS